MTTATDYPNGADCAAFIACGDRGGIKAFYSAEQAESHRSTQFRLSSFGLAPNCADCIQTVDYGDGPKWAYYTDRAEMFDQSRWPDSPYVASCEAQCEELRRKLYAVGFVWAEGEDHTGNYGWIDGRCVLVDCGN